MALYKGRANKRKRSELGMLAASARTYIARGWPATVSFAGVHSPIGLRLGLFVGPNKVGRVACGAFAWVALMAVYFLMPGVNEIAPIPRLLMPIGAAILAVRVAWTPVSRLLFPALSGSFTEMVQLITLTPNETFHGTVLAKNHSTTLVFVQVVVSNDGSPSVADGWSMWMTVDGADIEAGGTPLPDFTYRLRPDMPAIEYTYQEAIFNKSVAQPITSDAPARGYFIGRFDLPTDVVANNLDSLRLRFKDRLGRVYEAVPKKRGRLRPDAEVVPGIGKVVR